MGHDVNALSFCASEQLGETHVEVSRPQGRECLDLDHGLLY